MDNSKKEFKYLNIIGVVPQGAFKGRPIISGLCWAIVRYASKKKNINTFIEIYKTTTTHIL